MDQGPWLGRYRRADLSADLRSEHHQPRIRGAQRRPIPVLRPVPLWCAQTLARIAVERKWVVAVYLITGFIVVPALVIILVGVL
jgi:hypothetical protein